MKERERKEFERLEELRKTIEKSPLTKQIITEEAAAILVTRKEAAGKIEVLQKEREEVIPKLQEAVKDKEAAYLKAKAALDAAQGELQTAKHALSVKSHDQILPFWMMNLKRDRSTYL